MKKNESEKLKKKKRNKVGLSWCVRNPSV